MTQHEHKDKIYARRRSRIEPFRFDQQVAAVFPDMIRRSVPGYASIIDGIAVIAGEYLRDNSHGYDLGCSLGAAAMAMSRGAAGRNCRIFAVDNSAAMLQQAARLVAHDDAGHAPVTLVQSDLLQVALSNASMVVLNFTLQFIPPPRRAGLLRRIADAMLPGGVLLVSEKIRFDDAEANLALIRLHHAFKRDQGYSELEISQKREALENVLVPETLQVHVERLREAGFSRVLPWFQQLNFVSLLAIRR